MIYVPTKEDYKCFIVRDKDTIRAYKQIPETNSSVDYTDFYINSHYLSRNDTEVFNRYQELPTCLDNSQITSDIYYRNDMPDILVMFLVLCIFCFLIPLKIFVRLFRRFQ